ELVESPSLAGRLAGGGRASGTPGRGFLDLTALGPEQGRGLGAGRPRLELGEIDDPDAGQTLEILAVLIHGWFPPASGPSTSVPGCTRPDVTPPASGRVSPLKRPPAHFIIARPVTSQGGSMARIPLVTRDQIAEKEKPAYDAFMLSRGNRPNIGPYSLLLHMPEMAQRLEALRTCLRDEASLPPRLQELV